MRQLHWRFAEAAVTTSSPARGVVVARSIRPQRLHGAYQFRHMMRRECVERRGFARAASVRIAEEASAKDERARSRLKHCAMGLEQTSVNGWGLINERAS